jgi:hypothetical protein
MKNIQPYQEDKDTQTSKIFLFFKLLDFFFLFLSCFFFVGLGFEFRALHLQSRCMLSPLEPQLQSIFALVILEMGCRKLFAWAGLELLSS